MKRGIYFIANDSVLELTIAFLNSLRVYNPDIAVCLIPYDNNIDMLKMLRRKYNFIIFKDVSLLKTCDNISKDFHGDIKGHYRKFAIWEGVFDEFIYIDIDTVILHDLSANFNLLNHYDVLTSVSNIPSMRKWVWKDSIYSTNKLSKKQIEFAANSGFIVSKKSIITMNNIFKKIPAAVKLKEHMELWCVEQSLFNYVIVTSLNIKYSSLYELRWIMGNSYIITERWAGEKGGHIFKRIGKVAFPDLQPVLFFHWAGEWQPNKFEKMLGRKIRFFMPYKKLWKFYRYFDDKKAKQLNVTQFKKARIVG